MYNANANWGQGVPPVPGRRRAHPANLVLRPLRWLANLVIVAGIVLMAVTAPWGELVTAVRGSADAVGAVEPGETEQVELPEAGEYILFAEGEVVVSDCGDELCPGNFTEPEVTVADADGVAYELGTPFQSLSDVGTESMSLWSFEVDEPTTVVVAVGPDTEIDRIAVAPGPELELDGFRGVIAGAVVLFIGIIARSVLAAIGGLLGV